MLEDISSLTNQEKNWLKEILSCNFQNKETVVQQLENATIYRDYTSGYLSMKFSVDKSIPAVKVTKRVPVEMHVFKDGKNPIVFLLHVINGYVTELEVYCADLSEIDSHIDIYDAKIEFIT